MPEQINNSLSPNEIINFIENNYSESQLNDILKIFLRAEHTIPDSKLLKDLLNKNIMCLSFAPYLSYRFEKYFSKHGIEKISKRKEFIFQKFRILKACIEEKLQVMMILLILLKKISQTYSLKFYLKSKYMIFLQHLKKMVAYVLYISIEN